MDNDSENVEAMLVAARSDAAAFGAFYRLLERPVIGFFMRATQRADLAADLAAETFACALESVEGYDPERGRPDQWLFGIARNVLRNSYRRGRVESAARRRLDMPRLELNDESIATIERLAADEGPVLAALENLPATQRLAIQAHVVEERDYPEIAAELQCSEAVVRQRVSRGLRTLRTRLAGEQ
jgi:RNA polymerase sigma-70 factor (ECF subfamily)